MKSDENNEQGSGATSAVSALMEERRRYESWIDALDQKRSTTADHVFARVHADYTSRLDAVVAKLATHADGLRHEIAALTSRLTSAREEHQAATDERAEAELRAHVGELSSDEWTRVSGESDKRLADLHGRATDLEQQLDDTRALLTDAERPTPAPTSVSAAHQPQPEDAPSANAAPIPASTPVSDTADTAEADMHVPSAAQEEEPFAPALPVTTSVSDAPAAPVNAAASRPSAAVQQPRSSGGFDELSFLRSVVDSPAGSVEAAPQDEPDEASKVDSFARRSREESVQRITGDQPLIMRSSGEELSRDSQALAYQRTPGSALDPIKDPAIEGAKTLKCGECGAMNYPTEWYCERCGAELASL